MKKIYIVKWAMLLSLTALLGACNKYLDIKPKGKQLLETAQDYANLFNSDFNVTYSNGVIAKLADDDWASPGFIISFKDGTFTIPYIMYQWADPTVTSRQPYYAVGSSPTTGSLYFACYSRINRISNIIIQSVDKATGPAGLIAQTKAEARVLRAYNYFMLINVYAKPYDAATAETDGGVPLATEFNLEVAPKKVSVAEIYKLIEADLEEALASGALAKKAANTYHPSLAMAYALKAKVHLYKREFSEAKEAALAAYGVNSYVFDLRAYVNSGMTTRIMADNEENIYYATAEENFANNGITNPAAISPILAAMFDQSNDTRFTGFFNFTTTAAGPATGNTDRAFAPAWDPGQGNVRNYFYNAAGIRTTEVILILAECAAREGNYGQMNTYLDLIRVKRVNGFTPTTLIPANTVDAVNIVVNERRKELLFGFHRVFDLRRLNMEPAFRQTLSRTLPANPTLGATPALVQTTHTLAPDSYLWVALFPKEEMENNTSLTNNVPY